MILVLLDLEVRVSINGRGEDKQELSVSEIIRSRVGWWETKMWP